MCDRVAARFAPGIRGAFQTCLESVLRRFQLNRAGERHRDAAEVGGTTAMKFSHGFSRLWPSVLTLAGYGVSFWLLAQTLKTMSVGTAYAIRAGLGTAAIVVIGMLFLGEGMTVPKAVGIALIIVGVVVLNLGGAH